MPLTVGRTIVRTRCGTAALPRRALELLALGAHAQQRTWTLDPRPQAAHICVWNIRPRTHA